MRNLTKLAIPQVLADNHVVWLAEYKADQTNNTKRCRYRHQQIKQVLKEETSNKCIYCESKIGHNTPGDIEHKVPSSKCIDRHFEWKNLTIACTECNRRKNNYYEENNSFIDSYSDDVDNIVKHLGPIVTWRTGDTKAEVSIRILELDNYRRKELIGRKIEKIEELNNLTERIFKAESTLKDVLKKKVNEMSDKKSEYSGMVLAILKEKRTA